MGTFDCVACQGTFENHDMGFDNMCVDCTDDRNHAFDNLDDASHWEENAIFEERNNLLCA